MNERATRAWATSYRASWVLPIVRDPIRDGAVVVAGDRIAWVGRAGEEPAALQARTVDLGSAVLAPGLVNAHTHLDLTVLRGMFDGLAFFDWIRALVACREALTPDELADSARLGVIEGLTAGVTAFGDTAPVTAPFDAMLELGVRGIAYLELFGPDPALAGAAITAFETRLAGMRHRETALVKLGVSPHAPYSVSDALYAQAAACARRGGLPIATHIAESADETALVSEGRGPFSEFLRGRGIAVGPRASTPVTLLERLGVLGPDVLLVHCVQCGKPDIDAIARSGAAVVTCPQSNRNFGHGSAPVATMRRAGVRVGVGSDSMASNDVMDPLREAAAALAGEPDATDADRWRLATLDGARALGLADRVGTIEEGKDADLAAFPVGGAGKAQTVPDVTPGAAAMLVVVAGVERLRDGRIVTAPEGVMARATAASQRVREWRARAARA